MSERWLPVVGYEGYYEVSDQGSVRRVAKDATFVLKARANKNGHLQVSLSRDGERRSFLVHRLVLTAFVGPCPDGMQGCHNDGNPARNVLVNLRWDTQSSNAFDSVRHGTHHEAIKTHCPLGHALENANLVPSALSQGRRNCLACSRARRHASKRGVPLTREVADRYFAEIVQASSRGDDRPAATQDDRPVAGDADRCPHGHVYGEGNLYLTPRGHRRCRKCDAIRKRDARRAVTHCIHGHELDEAGPKGRRICSTCRALRASAVTEQGENADD